MFSRWFGLLRWEARHESPVQSPWVVDHLPDFRRDPAATVATDGDDEVTRDRSERGNQLVTIRVVCGIRDSIGSADRRCSACETG